MNEKNVYIKPEIEVVEFDFEDIILTSPQSEGIGEDIFNDYE